MNRELKFRIWSYVDKAFIYFNVDEYPSGIARGVSEPQQYIGIKDKNDKEIYEGDIIKIGYGESEGSLGKVEYKFNSYMLRGKSGGIHQDTYYSCIYGKVMGNDFENGELMK